MRSQSVHSYRAESVDLIGIPAACERGALLPDVEPCLESRPLFEALRPLSHESFPLAACCLQRQSRGRKHLGRAANVRYIATEEVVVVTLFDNGEVPGPHGKLAIHGAIVGVRSV